jgi:predicted Zn-dependent protease with MMP-like domain
MTRTTSRSAGETTDWPSVQAPSLAELETLADAAFKRLPHRFRDLCKEVVIRVEDFPTDDVLDSMGIDSPFDLLGLYHGVDLARQSVMDASAMPEMVFLYRRPILDYWAEHKETLGAIVTHVLVHEIGHHFGLSDADMERIEVEAAALRDLPPA